MSYILDALRRAEADRERERGQVPGLHAQPLPGHPTPTGTSLSRWLPWAGGGLLLLAGVGAGSWWASSPQEPAAPAPRVASAPADAPPPAAPPVAAPPPAVAVENRGPVPLPASPPVASVPSAAAPVATPVATPAAPPAPPAVTAAPPAASPVPAPAEARIPRLAELPEALRRELPRLAISGSVYSDDAASRFVIINGEVVREGAKLGPDLTLEQIRTHELVLRFKEQRYRQPI